jgi:pimeloyl-ACP methyl ester carboxylesterase
MRYIKGILAAIKLQILGSKMKGEFKILSVVKDGNRTLVTLPRSQDTEVPGVQSLFWDSRAGHAVVQAVSRDSETVSFELLKIFRAEPEANIECWLSGWLGETPEDFGFNNYETVQLANRTQAWLVRRSSSRWIVHVHGRNALRGETLRNLKQFDELGFNQLTISHESDARPAGLRRRRSKLGATEWRQIETAVNFAQEQGATEITLFGWSLGAMFVGQFLLQSSKRELVSKVIFDSPLIDYPSTLRLQATLAAYSSSFGDYVVKLLLSSQVLQVLGFGFRKLPTLLFELNVPALVLYSKSDGFVSMENIEDLKNLNQKLELVEFVNGRHCRLFNQNEDFYKASLAAFISKY